MLGFLGFFAGWALGWQIERRVFSDPSYATKSATRSEAITVKSQTYYVEPGYANLFGISQLLLFTLSLTVVGGAYSEYRKRQEYKAALNSINDISDTES